MLRAMDDAGRQVSRSDDRLERAWRLIVARAFDPLTLDELAAEADLSPYHFARQFQARFGASPMAFVRACRMKAAARALTGDDAPALVELAFDLGFETQEGFTRAFKRAYGVSPGRFRRAAALNEERPMTGAASLANLTQEPTRAAPAYRVAGLKGRVSHADKSPIPQLWGRLLPRLPLPGQVAGPTFGVCWGEGEGGFDYLAGAPIAADAAVPEGLAVMDVPAATYLVFRQVLSGPDMNPQMDAAAKEIWGERLPKLGARLARSPDLEVYPETFDPTKPGAYVEWWIPIEA
jgi:AraC family transcriptional regulator